MHYHFTIPVQILEEKQLYSSNTGAHILEYESIPVLAISKYTLNILFILFPAIQCIEKLSGVKDTPSNNQGEILSLICLSAQLAMKVSRNSRMIATQLWPRIQRPATA